jgi:hypothetical protein
MLGELLGRAAFELYGAVLHFCAQVQTVLLLLLLLLLCMYNVYELFMNAEYM